MGIICTEKAGGLWNITKHYNETNNCWCIYAYSQPKKAILISRTARNLSQMRNNQLGFINVFVALWLTRGGRFKIDSEITWVIYVCFKKGLKIALR